MDEEKLFKICEILALSDSVAEGYNYNGSYSKEDYEKDKKRSYSYYTLAKEIYDLFDEETEAEQWDVSYRR